MTDGGFGPPIPSATDDGWGVSLNPSRVRHPTENYSCLLNRESESYYRKAKLFNTDCAPRLVFFFFGGNSYFWTMDGWHVKAHLNKGCVYILDSLN
jgi:hypothetical protein